MQNTDLLRVAFKKGDKRYTQIKRTHSVAMYKVEEKGGIYYEVFKIRLKTARKVALKSGILDVRQGEEYPSKKYFGKMAFCCSMLEVAQKRYEQILEKVSENP